jgi:hypothetical protein
MRKVSRKSVSRLNSAAMSGNFKGVPAALDKVAELADRAGYTTSYDQSKNELSFKAQSDGGSLPTITVTTSDDKNKSGGVVYWFTPKLEFPTLDMEDYDYSDALLQIINEWSAVGKMVDVLMKTSYDVSEEFD